MKTSEREVLSSPPAMIPSNEKQHPTRSGFNPDHAGKVAECDGGRPIPGTRFATREEFCGRLTGEYIDHGDPPWRWYLMVDLRKRPEGYEADAVWCEEASLFFVDE